MYLLRKLCTQTLSNCEGAIFRKYIQDKPSLLSPITGVCHLNLTRFKSKASKGKSNKVSGTETEEASSDQNYSDDIKDKHSKIMKINTNTMRVDALLKSVMGISRNKIEVLFYESKIRVNGEKIFKKSVNVNEGDEIDIIKGTSSANPDYLIVARMELLSAKPEDDHITVRLRRSKSLTIENYTGKHKWSQSEE